MKKTIWFDITILYNWNRPPVGIVRVELECARHLLSEFGEQTRFCRYDGIKGAHVEVSHNEVAAYIRGLDGDGEESRSHLTKGLEWRLKYFTKKVVRYSCRNNYRAGRLGIWGYGGVP